jgi:threonyl-tRNA synthetase
MTDSHKRAYKNEEFKLKTINCSPKIKKASTVKLKKIFVDLYFHPHQTSKIFSIKHFTPKQAAFNYKRKIVIVPILSQKKTKLTLRIF